VGDAWGSRAEQLVGLVDGAAEVSDEVLGVVVGAGAVEHVALAS